MKKICLASVMEKNYNFDFFRDLKLAKELNVLLMC